MIQKESARASAIIRDLSLSRQQPGVQSRATAEVVDSVLQLRKRRFTEAGIRIAVQETGEPVAMAVFEELQQVVLNLVINASRPSWRRRLLVASISNWHGSTGRCGSSARSGPVCRPRTRPNFPAVFYDEGIGRGHGARLVGQLRHRRVPWRHDRIPGAHWWRRLLFRASGCCHAPDATIRLYYDEPYRTTFDATVTSCVTRYGAIAVMLDRTAFYPRPAVSRMTSGRGRLGCSTWWTESGEIAHC